MSRLGELSAGVEGLRRTIDREREARERSSAHALSRIDAADRAHNRSTWALGVAILIALVVAVLAFAQNVEDRRQQNQLEDINNQRAAEADQRLVDQCNSGNAARASIRDSFDQFTNALVATSVNTPRTPEEQAAYEARVAAFRADLAARLAPLNPRDCSPEALGLAPAPNALS